VEASRLGDRARSKLIRLLSDDHPEPGPWVGRLKSLSDLENAPVFADAVRFLFHLKVGDAEAEGLLDRVLDHRRILTRVLGRDPGLRVAAMDYLRRPNGRPGRTRSQGCRTGACFKTLSTPRSAAAAVTGGR